MSVNPNSKQVGRVFGLVAVGENGEVADAFGIIKEWILMRVDRTPGHETGPFVLHTGDFQAALAAGHRWNETGEL